MSSKTKNLRRLVRGEAWLLMAEADTQVRMLDYHTEILPMHVLAAFVSPRADGSMPITEGVSAIFEKHGVTRDRVIHQIFIRSGAFTGHVRGDVPPSVELEELMEVAVKKDESTDTVTIPHILSALMDDPSVEDILNNLVDDLGILRAELEAQ